MYDLAPSSRERARILAEAELKASSEMASVHVNGSSGHNHESNSPSKKTVDPYSALLLKEATRAHGDSQQVPQSAANAAAAAAVGDSKTLPSSSSLPAPPPVGVTCLASSALLGLLVTGGGDGSLRFWDSEFFSLEAHLPLAVATRRTQALALLRQDHAEAMAQSDRAKGRRTASNNPSDARNNGNTINGIESGSCLANTSLAKSAAYSGTFGLKASRLESVEELKERDAKRNATQKLPVGRAARAAAKAEKARLAEKSRRAALTEDERRAEDEAKEVESLANSIAAGATIGGGSVSAGSAAGGGGASGSASTSAGGTQSIAQKRVSAQRRRSSLALAQLTAASKPYDQANNHSGALEFVPGPPTPSSVRSSESSSLMPDSPIAMGWGGPLSPTFNGQMPSSNDNDAWPGTKALAPTPLPAAPLWEVEGDELENDDDGEKSFGGGHLNMPSAGNEPNSAAMLSLDMTNFSVVTSAEVSVAPLEAAPVPDSTASRSKMGSVRSRRGGGTPGSTAGAGSGAGHSDVEPPTVRV